MKKIQSKMAVLLVGYLATTFSHNTIAASTIVTDAIGTQELWTFEEILGAQKLVSKINQADGKGITQTWDERGNMLTRTDSEGRTTAYKYNVTNQRTSMTEAVGTPQERVTTYEYVNADIDLVTKTSSPSIYPNQTKTVTNTYDSNLNITAVSIDGYDAVGNPVSRTTSFKHDVYGKVIEINGPRTDVYDITVIEYYDCNTGSECGQVMRVTNALGHTTTYDAYDRAARLLQMTDPNGVVTSYSYHPRGWLLNMVQTSPAGAVRVTAYEYDNVGQLIKMTLPAGSEQNYSYDAAYDLRGVSDNLGNKVEYTYDAKGNRTHQLINDPDGTLIRSSVISYDIRNFVEAINDGGSVTEMINDAVGNLSSSTDPNLNPSTDYSFDALDRVANIVDRLMNNTSYQYDVADQITKVTAPNGSTTQYEYDDLGNQTKEVSSDRGSLAYTHDDAGNILSVSDDRGITRNYGYDALNRLISTSYPDSAENVNYEYDLVEPEINCGASIGNLCQVSDESGQTNYTYDVWGNIVQHAKLELGISYMSGYQYDTENRIVQMTYPNGRAVNYLRDAIGRIMSVTTTRLGDTVDVLNNRTYRADNSVTGHILGNGLVETRDYDLQGRVTQIQAGTLATWDYVYDANGNITQITKPQANYYYNFDVLDRLISEADGISSVTERISESDNVIFDDSNESFVSTEAPTESVDVITYSYDANSNRLSRNNRDYEYQVNSNVLVKDGNIDITQDEIGNTLTYRKDRSLTYSDSGRLRTVSKGGELRAVYRYNAFNQRTRKEIPNKRSQVFHYDLYGNLILRTRDNGKPIEDYIWVDGELIQFTKLKGNTNSTISEISEKTFITNDHLMTPRLGSNDVQTKTWEWVSDAFNKPRPQRDPDGDGTKVNLKIGFPGQYYDAESGLYYNWNRYYDRRLGRYVTSDPIGLDGGLNTYSYALGNPLIGMDSQGLQVDSVSSRILAALARGNARQLNNIRPIINNPNMRNIVDDAIQKLQTPARDLIRGRQQRSNSFHEGLADKTYEEIIKLSRQRGDLKRAAQQMKKLIEQSERLAEKIKNCPK